MSSLDNVDLVCPAGRKDEAKRQSPTEFNGQEGRGHFHRQSEAVNHGHLTRDRQHSSRNVTATGAGLQDGQTGHGRSDNRTTRTRVVQGTT